MPADPLGSQLLPHVSLAGAVAARQLPTQMSEGHAGAGLCLLLSYQTKQPGKERDGEGEKW